MRIEAIHQELDKISECANKAFVIRYNGKNVKVFSGKSSWRLVHHAKRALLNHFHELETRYKYGWPMTGYIGILDKKFDNFTREEISRREEEFRQSLWESVEIVEL